MVVHNGYFTFMGKCIGQRCLKVVTGFEGSLVHTGGDRALETKNASAAARNQTRIWCAANGAVASYINCATTAAPEQVTYNQLRQTMFAVDLWTLNFTTPALHILRNGQIEAQELGNTCSTKARVYNDTQKLITGNRGKKGLRRHEQMKGWY